MAVEVLHPQEVQLVLVDQEEVVLVELLVDVEQRAQ